MSQANLAREVGTSQQTIQRIESGQTSNSLFRSMVIDLLSGKAGKKPDAFVKADDRLAQLGIQLNNTEGKELSPFNYKNVSNLVGNLLSSSGQLIPVFTLKESSENEFTLNNDPIDMIVRPEPLQFASNAYGLYISDDSMSPVLRIGDIALVNPNLPPLVGEDHVFKTAESNNDDSYIQVRNLISFNFFVFEVAQFNPRAETDLGRSLWTECHRIVGKFSGRT